MVSKAPKNLRVALWRSSNDRITSLRCSRCIKVTRMCLVFHHSNLLIIRKSSRRRVSLSLKASANLSIDTVWQIALYEWINSIMIGKVMPRYLIQRRIKIKVCQRVNRRVLISQSKWSRGITTTSILLSQSFPPGSASNSKIKIYQASRGQMTNWIETCWSRRTRMARSNLIHWQR